MATRIRTRLHLDALRANREQLVRLGLDVRAARLRRRLTQAQLGGLVGLSQSAISRAERGLGGGLTLDAWPAGTDLPREPGLVWSRIDGSHLFAWRRRPRA